MAKVREPRFKLCRRLGLNVIGHEKAMKRANIKNSRAGKKLSDYGIRLLEKQRLRAYYGVLEKQFERYMDEAFASKDMPGEKLLMILESRLDNMVYRIGLATSLRGARQMVNHGHILVNGKKVNIPSYRLKVGDEVSLREKSRKNKNYLEAIEMNRVNSIPYVECDLDNFRGVYKRYPQREELPIEINEQFIVEFYSK